MLQLMFTHQIEKMEMLDCYTSKCKKWLFLNDAEFELLFVIAYIQWNWSSPIFADACFKVFTSCCMMKDLLTNALSFAYLQPLWAMDHGPNASVT